MLTERTRQRITVSAFILGSALAVGFCFVDGSARSLRSLSHAQGALPPCAAREGQAGISGIKDRFCAYEVAVDGFRETAASALGVDDYFSGKYQQPIEEAKVNLSIGKFQEIVRDTPQEDGAWSDLAWLYALRGDESGAIIAEQKAIDLCATDYTYHVLLGAFEERAGKNAEAGAAYGAALTLNPRLLESKFWSSLTARNPPIAAAATGIAISSLEMDVRSRGDIILSERLSRVEIDTNVGSARDIKVAEGMRNFSGYWELEGTLQERAGREGEAALDYRRAAFLDGADSAPHNALATLYLREGFLSDAKAEAIEAWKRQRMMRGPHSLRMSILYNRAVAPRYDLIPLSIGEETQPFVDYQRVFASIGEAFAARGDSENAELMEELAAEAEELGGG